MDENKKLIRAIEGCNLLGIDKFLNSGGDVNSFLHNDVSLLMYSIHCAYTTERQTASNSCKEFNCNINSKYKPGDDIILRLIDGGADPNYKNCRGYTVLMCALEFNRGHEVIYQLLTAGSDVTAVDHFERTALIHAIKEKYDESIVTAIINKGANVNQLNQYGWTPLFFAICNYEYPEVFKTLIDSGANPQAHDDKGINLLMRIFCRNCNEDNCTYKLITDTLLNNGVNLKEIDNDGNTVIHHVSCNYLIRLAIRAGVCIDRKNYSQNTPLKSALKIGNFKKVKNLLLYGAEPNHCVDYAVVRASPTDIINLFFYCGANLHAKSFEHLTERDFLHGLHCNCGKDYSAVNALIKNFLLFCNETELSSVFKSFHTYKQYFQTFIEECKKELGMLKNTYITDSLSFYEFCYLMKHQKSNVVDIPANKYNYPFSEIKKLFSNYSDLIIMRIKDNNFAKWKRILLNSLENIIIKQHMIDLNSDTSLDYDCLYQICRYLNHSQIYNLFLASL